MSQQSNSRSLSKVALLSLIGLLLAGCSMSGASKPIEPYVALVSDGILGKTWSYTDSSGRDYAMRPCDESRSFFSKSCAETNDSVIQFEWYSWRDSSKAPTLTIEEESFNATCDRGPLDLLQLKCRPVA